MPLKVAAAAECAAMQRKSGSENATLINNYINEGKIVPVEITVALIKAAMVRTLNRVLCDPRGAGAIRGQEISDRWLPSKY